MEAQKSEKQSDKQRKEDPRLNDPPEYDDDMDFHRTDAPPPKAGVQPKTNSQPAQT